ncbi:MAG: DNA-directed RNA polymerase subunit alpha [Candidatus Magasanikbacteria bacterium]|nr:DNA-directed RNA polymerase subunit alpha [Candidatus Magasanikbacteria bacterium]
MEKLLLPSTIQIQDGDQPHRGRVVITPCYHGYGTTIGNALRRVLLSSLPGAAVTAVKIKGVQHEFSTVPGVKEDIVDIILNLKKLRLRVFSAEPVTIALHAKGVGEVTADAIKATSDVEIINKDFVIATITDAKTELDMDLTVGQGRGYVPVEERKRETMDIGTIAIDAIYTPIVDVGYSVDFTRVGDVTNYEKLTLDIETDGTMSPKDALNQAVEILMDHLRIIQGGMESVGLEKEEAPSAEEIAEEATDTETASKDAAPESEDEDEEEVKEDEAATEEPAEEEEEEPKEE